MPDGLNPHFLQFLAVVLVFVLVWTVIQSISRRHDPPDENVDYPKPIEFIEWLDVSVVRPQRRSGTRGEGRTLNLRLRRPTLYPIELLAHADTTLGQSVPRGNLKSAPEPTQRREGAETQGRVKGAA